MNDFSLGILTEHRYLQNYEVFCNRCSDSIGVMSTDTIRSAIFATLNRGGVLCPPCRLSTCDGCGGVENDGVYNIADGPKGGPARLCVDCTRFNRMINEQIDGALFGEESFDTEVEEVDF